MSAVEMKYVQERYKKKGIKREQQKHATQWKGPVKCITPHSSTVQRIRVYYIPFHDAPMSLSHFFAQRSFRQSSDEFGICWAIQRCNGTALGERPLDYRIRSISFLYTISLFAPFLLNRASSKNPPAVKERGKVSFGTSDSRVSQCKEGKLCVASYKGEVLIGQRSIGRGANYLCNWPIGKRWGSSSVLSYI